MLKKPPGAPPAEEKDPILDAAENGEQETRDLFREVSSRVRYADFSEAPWERFRTTKRLAMLDLWSERTDVEKLERSGLGPSATENELATVRESDLYGRLTQALAEAFRDAATPKSAAEWVAAMEDASFRRLARIAKHAIDPKVAATAARDFADRALPKVSRNNDRDGGAPVLMITEDGARLLMAALDTVKRKTVALPSASDPGE